MYPCAEIWNPPNFARTRVGRKSIRPEMPLAKDLRLKQARFYTYPCRGVLHTPRNVLRRWFGSKIGRVLGVSLLGWVKSGAFLAYPDGEI